MKCDLCSRNLSGDSTFKKADAQTDGLAVRRVVREHKVFCDGPSLSEALGKGLSFVKLMPTEPTEQQIKKYAKFRLCAQLYKAKMTHRGYTVIINRVQKKLG